MECIGDYIMKFTIALGLGGIGIGAAVRKDTALDVISRWHWEGIVLVR